MDWKRCESKGQTYLQVSKKLVVEISHGHMTVWDTNDEVIIDNKSAYDLMRSIDDAFKRGLLELPDGEE